MTRNNFLTSLSALLAYCACTFGQSASAQELAITPEQTEEFGDDLFAEEEELESDRDSFTRSPRLMPTGGVMVEASYTFLDQDAVAEGHLYPDLLVRFGVCEWVEARIGWTYEVAKFHHLAPPLAEPAEEGIINYSAKFRVTPACGVIPDSALVVTGYTPTSGESSDTDFSLEYIYGWKRCDWELDGMIRWFSLAEEDDQFTEWAPSVVLKRSILCERANVHVEYFSLHSQNRDEEYDQYYFGPGAHYLLTPNFEIGARVFWGVGEDSAEFISNVGFAARR